MFYVEYHTKLRWSDNFAIWWIKTELLQGIYIGLSEEEYNWHYYNK